MADPIARIMIVDDEPQIRRFVRASLTAHGYEVIEAGDGAEAIRKATIDKPDVIVLDLGLPDIEGIEVTRRIREWSKVPIIVLTVRNREEDKIDALDRGADDYVTKPFGMGELMARIRASLRRRLVDSGAEPVFRSGGLTVDLVKRIVTLGGTELRLSPREYDLLSLLVRHAGRVVTHQQILREIWGPAHEKETQYLRVYIGQLRQKLGDDPSRPSFIVTEPGVGYRLRDGDAG